MEEIQNEKKAPTTPYSVRLPEDLKTNLIDTLASSGYSAPEFFARMVNHFQIQEGKKPTRPEVQEMTKAVKRINDAFESLILTVEVAESDKTELSTKYAADSQSTAQELENIQLLAAESEKTLRQALKDIENQKNQIENEKTELLKEINRLKSVEEMIDEIRQESKLAKENLKTAIQDRDVALITSQNAQIQVNDLKTEKNSLQAKLDAVKEEIKESKQSNQILAEKLEKASELKNQAIGELNSIRPHAQQLAKEIADLRAQFDQERLETFNAAQSLKLAESELNQLRKQPTPMQSVMADIEKNAPEFINNKPE